MFFLSLLVFSTIQLRGQDRNASNGIIYYNGEEDLQLYGEWRFYWKQLYQDNPLLEESSDFEIVDIPSLWNSYEINGEKLSDFGYATYSLTVIADKEYSEMALELPGFYTNYNLYFNGVKTTRNGTVGKSAEISSLQWIPQTVSIKLEKGENKLVVEISNFHHSKGGFFSNITLGDSEALFQRREFQVMVDMFAIGCHFFIGMFLLASYMFWNKDRALLYCALFALCYSMRLSLYDLHLFNVAFTNVSPWISIRMAYLFFYSSWLFFVLFFSVVFKEDFIVGVKQTMLIVSGLVILSTLILPLKFYSLLVGPYTYFGVIISLPCLFIIGKAVANKRRGSILAACSMILP